MHVYRHTIQYKTDTNQCATFQGVYYPSVTALMVQWAPPAERSRLLSFASAGKGYSSVEI